MRSLWIKIDNNRIAAAMKQSNPSVNIIALMVVKKARPFNTNYYFKKRSRFSGEITIKIDIQLNFYCVRPQLFIVSLTEVLL